MPARRTGVIHAWDGDAPAGFALDGPVPVVVRDPGDPRFAASGTVASGRVESGELWADIDWPEDVESRAGASTPSASCEFDGSGRLVRVVVELDDGDPSPGDPAAPPTDLYNPTQPGDRQAATAGDSSPPNRRQAEMAANDRQPNADDANRDHAEMAGHDDGGNQPEPTLAELRAERDRIAKALAETNRKQKADRLRLEEFEKAQREAEEAKLGEGDRIKRERDQQNQARLAAEQQAKAARDELDRLRIDFEIERMALSVGFEFPEQAAALVDRELIDYDEDTRRPLNLKDVIKRLVDKYPNLVKPVAGRPGTPPRTGPVGRPGAPDPRNEPIPIEFDLRRKVNYPGR